MDLVYLRFKNYKMFHTQNLDIKSFVPQDASAFFELTSDDGFNLFPITIYRQKSVETALAWIEQNVGKLAVWEKSSGALIGMGGLTPWTFESENLIDITYRLRQAVWGKGYGHELAAGLVKYGFEVLKLPEITATITPDNVASKKIAMKLGFVFDQHITLKGVATDLYRLKK